MPVGRVCGICYRIVMKAQDIVLEPLQETDLPVVNAVVEKAILGWSLPERVKRLSLPSYRYDPTDLAHQHGLVAREPSGGIVGVAVWEAAPDEPVTGARDVFRLHGLYVDPQWQRQGIGRRLLAAVIRAVCTAGADGLVIRAQADAVPFFQAMGLERLPVNDAERDYPNRFWASCQSEAAKSREAGE